MKVCIFMCTTPYVWRCCLLRHSTYKKFPQSVYQLIYISNMVFSKTVHNHVQFLTVSQLLHKGGVWKEGGILGLVGGQAPLTSPQSFESPSST